MDKPYIVVIERNDEDPLLVKFAGYKESLLFCDVVNEMAEEFIDDYHWYARPPVQGIHPMRAIGMLLEEKKQGMSREKAMVEQARDQATDQALKWAEERRARKAERDGR